MDRIDLTMERFEVLVRWEVWHDYFEGGVCRCVELIPDRQSMGLLKRRDVKFKKLETNVWGLVGKKDTVWDPEDEVILETEITDSFFACYTDGNLPEEVRWSPGGKEKTELRCKAKCLKWEYVILMKEWRPGCQWELKETTGKMEFRNEGMIRMNGRRGFRMVATVPVMLREKYDYTIRLSERKSFGNKVICKQLPWPVPGRFPECGEGCVRQIVVV